MHLRLLTTACLIPLAACSSTGSSSSSGANAPQPAAPASARSSAENGLTLEAIYGRDAYASPLPTDILWRSDGASFLCRDEEGERTRLLEHVVATGEVRELLDWTKLQDDLKSRRPDYVKPAMGDTNRTGRFSFPPLLSPADDQLLGTVAGDLYVVDLTSGAATFITDSRGEEIFFQWRPDGGAVAFAREGDLYVVDLASGQERRLTDRGAETTVLNGVADWVYEEELALRQSFWWSPDGGSIAYLQFDTSPIPIIPITDELHLVPHLEHQRYPKTGAANSRVRLGVLELASRETTWLASGDAPEAYLVDAEWIAEGPAAGSLWYLWLNRDQTRLELRLAEPSGSTRTLAVEEDERWVEVGPDPLFLADGTFLWTSERSGWRHLYRWGLDGSRRDQLTSGEWVVSAVDGLGSGGGTVLFRSNEGAPLDTHVWSVGLDGRGKQRLTAPSGTHSADVAPGGQTWLDTWSTAEMPPRLELYRSNGELVRTVDDGAIAGLADLSPTEFELVDFGDGTSLWTKTVRPPDFDPARRYPVVVYVYGGPGSQLVRNSWGDVRGLYHQVLARRGAVVFTLDNRGAGGRGAAFERQLYRRLGSLEVEDQVRGAQWLASQPGIDASRIGIYGGSYGGFMTLLCLMRAPDVFRSGVAWAPVTDFRFYDTIYTERYMDRPRDNAEGYTSGAPLEHVEGLRDGSLLLAHGLMDNNVHFQNTVELLDALVAAEKQFEFMAYPRTRHGIRGEAKRLHFHQISADFFARTLELSPAP